MSGSVTITPGYLAADGQPVTEANLRAIAQPTGQVGAGQIGARELDLASVIPTLGLVGQNALDSGNLPDECWLNANVVSIPISSWYYLAFPWGLKANGFPVTAQRSTQTPANINSMFSLQIAGNSAVTGVDLAQDLNQTRAAQLARQITFSAWIWNLTGVDLTPKFVLSTANSQGDFTEVTEQVEVNMQTCSTGIWRKVSATVDATELVNIKNGLRVSLRIGSEIGGSGRFVYVTQLKLERGPAATEPMLEPPLRKTIAAANVVGLTATMSNDSVSSSFSDTYVSWVDAVLKSKNGYAVSLPAGNAWANLSRSGLGGLDAGSRETSTWYYLWLVSDGYNFNTLWSRQSTLGNVTLPGNYQYAVFLGANRTGSDGKLQRQCQTGLKVSYTSPLLLINNKTSSGSSWNSESLASIVPPMANKVVGMAGKNTSVQPLYMLIQADFNAGATGTSPVFLNAPANALQLAGIIGASFYAAAPFEVHIQGKQSLMWCYADFSTAAPGHTIIVTGYEL